MDAWTEDRVRHLLQTVAELPEARRPLLGARLGLLLRKIAPEFRANILGDLRLTDLLRRFPDLVIVRPDMASQDVVIEFSNFHATDRLHECDIESSSTDGDQLPTQTEVLDQHLWKAMVGNRDDARWFLDLESISVVEVPVDFEGRIAPDSEPARAPERFLAVPPIPQDELRDVMREYLQKLTSVELRSELAPLIEKDDWFPQLSARIYELGLTSWRLAHRRFVIERARSWLLEHGLRPERFIRFVSPRTRPFNAQQPRPLHTTAPARLGSGLGERDIRALVLKAISRMSEQELLDLRIPLRYLI